MFNTRHVRAAYSYSLNFLILILNTQVNSHALLRQGFGTSMPFHWVAVFVMRNDFSKPLLFVYKLCMTSQAVCSESIKVSRRPDLISASCRHTLLVCCNQVKPYIIMLAKWCFFMLFARACTAMFYIVTSLEKLTANLVWFEATSTFQYFQIVPGVHSSFVVSLDTVGNQSFFHHSRWCWAAAGPGSAGSHHWWYCAPLPGSSAWLCNDRCIRCYRKSGWGQPKNCCWNGVSEGETTVKSG